MLRESWDNKESTSATYIRVLVATTNEAHRDLNVAINSGADNNVNIQTPLGTPQGNRESVPAENAAVIGCDHQQGPQRIQKRHQRNGADGDSEVAS